MLKTIPAKKLKPGVFLHKLCGKWESALFGAALLKDERDVTTIQKTGVEQVVIDTNKGLDILLTSSKGTRGTSTQQEEWSKAQLICSVSKEAVESMFKDARMGKVIPIDKTTALVDEISASVLRCTDTLISIARLKTRDDYTYMHSVAVCGMMIALAREVGFNEDGIKEAGVAGLMHDIGKSVMPLDVLNKPGKLTDDEFTIMKSHPAEGLKMLSQVGGMSPGVMDVVLHHHEKVDGSGYPKKLKGNDISLLSRMGAICDVYDAITSNRPYKSGWDPAISIKRMVSWEGHFDPRLLQCFIKVIGIYPVGSLVRLESNRLGVVIEQSASALLAPQVRVFYCAQPKGPIPVELIDLADANGKDRIVSAEDSTQWGFTQLNELWVPG
jgi:putative nucleotidyltransferase with HDIG domain